MTYRTTAAYPYIADADRAVAALCGNLRVASARDDAAPDWSTIRVTGPTEVIDARGIVWYEWTAAVDAHGAACLPETLEPRQRQRPARGSRTGVRP